MEFITNTFDQLNWWAILAATLSTLLLGALWYDMKMGYGKRWAKLNGIKMNANKKQKGMALPFITMTLTSLATVFMMACLIKATGVQGFAHSLMFGVIFGLIFRGGAHFIHDGFAQKPMELTNINVAHDLVSLTIVALILGLWK